MDDPLWDYSHQPLRYFVERDIPSRQRPARPPRDLREFAHSSDEVTVEAKAPIYIYDRLGEPNKDMLEENLALQSTEISP